MKKLTKVMILSLSLLLSTTLVFAEKATTFLQQTQFNNRVIKLPTIIINQENYVKLRDLAQILKNSEREFGIEYSYHNQTIDLDTSKKYESVGTELAGMDIKNPTLTKSTEKVSVNKKTVDITGYQISGYNYYRLKDLGKVLNLNIGYDNKLKRVILSTEDSKVLEPAELSFVILDSKYEYSAQQEQLSYNVDGDKLEVNFTKSFSSAGNSLNVSKVLFDGKDIKIITEVTSPPPNTAVAQVITYQKIKMEIKVPNGFNGSVSVEGLNPVTADK